MRIELTTIIYKESRLNCQHVISYNNNTIKIQT